MSNSSDQEQNHASENSQNQENQNGDVKMMTQSEYLRYKQENSNANNYYGFSREVDSKPVAWVSIIKIIKKIKKFLNFIILGYSLQDGKFATPDPSNFFIVPNRNASNVRDFYGFDKTPTISPVAW